ncbi:transcriptional regulator, LysR family [Cupriavidus sp. OV038]|jgi:LysR family tcuABC transcriptional regulator|uniref:LysR family transcriptional regulator n=1 Tax=unclassified Cupriavidus TaxID=2640874 RepID=UPI0008F0FB41|nr:MULTISPECIES: LysR substrate-binding domain-containing protein [unclassified Cupriavidus]SFC97548.1 transcriptional regulator, LysR family [Cupriavidus sp. OV038]SFP63907.1 transcriptional regulator, LysR family [Cupriavidus sp. OV096]
MELRQLQYFVRVVELGSMSRAALELDMVQSAVSQQISRLEGELSTRLLRRTPQGVTPTEAGLAFFHEAQLTLRHAEQARRAAHHARLSGTVSVGLAPTTASVIGVPLIRAMRERYPDVRLHIVESLSGHLTAMLNARQLDLAVLFDTHAARRWTVLPLLEETLFLIQSRQALPQGKAEPPTQLGMADLAEVPLIMPTGVHGLRSTLDAAFARAKVAPRVIQEVDSLAMLMSAVDMGFGATLQPWAAVGRYPDAATRFHLAQIDDPSVGRRNLLCSLSDDELSPAALALRVVLADTARGLVKSGGWRGARLIEG